MKTFAFILVLLFAVTACDDDSNRNNSTNNTNNINNTNNVNACEGDAPFADLQDGVCGKALKVCDATSLAWVEPDYTLIFNYEVDEISCDTHDNDCDGDVDEELKTDFYPDTDRDSFGDAEATPITTCGTPVGHVIDHTDCDDTSGTNHPDADEVCDGVDNNCNIQIDEGLTTFNFYPDTDGDGYGDDSATVVTNCATPLNYVGNNSDCDDTTGLVSPDATEICNNIDDDCDSIIDTDATDRTLWYLDTDSDNHGDPSDSILACDKPSERVADNTDCAPGNRDHWADCETCTDADNDGYGAGCDLGIDCDDGNTNCNTGCTTYYDDTDGDGHGNSAISQVLCEQPAGFVTTSDDCNISDANHWNDCTTCVDADTDGYGTGCDLGFDCDDDATTGPTCFNSCTNFYFDSDIDGHGDSSVEVTKCIAPSGYVVPSDDCDDTNPYRYPGALEICNGIDMDCDTVIDAGTCQGNSSCADDEDTIDAYCLCDANYIELLSDPGVCHEAIQPPIDALVVTEVMIEAINSNSVPDGQYFEVYNTTDATLELSDIGFLVDNLTEDATSEVGIPTLLASNDYFIIALTDATGLNGGVDVDHVFLGMPELNTEGGYIELYRVSNSDSFDIILWDDTWNHSIGTSLNLSPGALDGDPTVLNDDGPHWCHTRFSVLTEGDKGTPGSANDDCLVNLCNVQDPPSISITIGETTELIYGQVYEPGLTEPGGQGAFISSELGYGPENTTPDASWLWTVAAYNTDDGNNDEYMQDLTPTIDGTYDYAYRTSMDGGLTWLYCDISGSEGDGSTGYDMGDSGVLTVIYAVGLSPEIPALSCNHIANTNENIVDGIFWIDPDGTDGMPAYQVFCNQTGFSGGWTMAFSLETSDGDVRDFQDTEFWTSTSVLGTPDMAFSADYKSHSFTDLPVTDILICAHANGSEYGCAKYTLTLTYTGKTLQNLFSSYSNITLTGNRSQVSGSVGNFGRTRNAGDPFIDHNHPLILNSTYSPVDASNLNRIGTNYSDQCGTINCNGHNFGGIGGTHFRSTWGAHYEAAALNGYCDAQGGYGTDNRDYGTFSNAFNGCGHVSANVDYAIYIR
jgi:Putative metal-binding motif